MISHQSIEQHIPPKAAVTTRVSFAKILVATDFSESCTIVDANTVAIKGARDKDPGFTGPKLDSYWFDGEGVATISSDGNHYRIVTQQKAPDGKVIRASERTFTRNAERCFSSDEQKFRECQQRTSPTRN